MRDLRIGGLPSRGELEQRQHWLRMSIVLLSFVFIPRSSMSVSVKDRVLSQEHSLHVDGSLENGELPVFEQTASNVTAFVGQTIYLPCRVKNLGDKVVSWMRSRDLHILTTSGVTFSSDVRFSPEHISGSDAWTLKLESARKSDTGTYECQVNTEPKIMYTVQLFVRDSDKPEGYDMPHSQQTRISYESTAPVAAIMGPREQRVLSGSTITLRCIITSPYQPRPIRGAQWLRDNKLLTFQPGRGGIIIETERITGRTVSEATLASVSLEDAGKYSCRPTEGKADSVLLIVQQGERTEAMQRDAGYVTSRCAEPNTRCSSFIFFIGLLILIKVFSTLQEENISTSSIFSICLIPILSK